MIICRKIQLYPLGNKEEINRTYKFIRDGQYAQNKAYNILISNIYSAILQHKTLDEIKEIYKLGGRNSDSKLSSLYDKDNIIFSVGLATPASVQQRVKADIKKATKDGLFKGRVSLPNKKLDAPLISESRFMKFTHSYTDEELKDRLCTNDCEITMEWVNNIRFKVILGSLNKSYELRSVFQNIFEEIYKVCGSSIQIDKNKIILNLSIDIPERKVELDENTVVGVDLGIAIPAVCGVNINNYVRKSIGSKEEFLKVKTAIQKQKRQEQKRVNLMAKGGHGRKKKLRSLDRFTAKEKHFCQTYNHMVSKQIIDFALQNKAKYINIEDLSENSFNDKILRNWSYYQLQQYIIYKAQKFGIIVRKVNPYHTSQICSECGHWEEGQRDSQAHFKCKKCGRETNADFNASRNIALSTDFR